MEEGDKLNKKIEELEDKKKEMEKIKKEIGELKEKKKQLRKDRVKNRNGTANKLIRVANSFSNKLGDINERREGKGLDKISNPKLTELIVKHKYCWSTMEKDLIDFNTEKEEGKDEEKK